MFAFNLMSHFAVVPLLLPLTRWRSGNLWLTTADLFKVCCFLLEETSHHVRTDRLIAVRRHRSRGQPLKQRAALTFFLWVKCWCGLLGNDSFKKPQEWTALPGFRTQKHSYTQNTKSLNPITASLFRSLTRRILLPLIAWWQTGRNADVVDTSSNWIIQIALKDPYWLM